MSETLAHESTAPLKGDAARALEAAIIALTAAGFKLERKTPSSAEMTANPMTSSNRQLACASRIRLSCTAGQLSAAEELGGVARLTRPLRVVPAAVMFGGGLAMAIAFYFKFGTESPMIFMPPAMLIAIGIAFLVFLAPAVARRLESRARASLDTLVMNASQLTADA